VTEGFFENSTFLILFAAILFDLVFKELPPLFHPVVWMGKIVDAYKNRFSPKQTRSDVMRSLGLTAGLPALAAGVGFVFSHFNFLEAIALSTTFSFGYFRGVLTKLAKVFRSEDLNAMRVGVGMLVSRNTQELSKEELIGAAIETTIENITDAVVAPLFFYLIGGLPLAMAYRAVNTLDAMIGYKDKYFFYGKIAARTDDVANFVPARITAAFLFLCAIAKREFHRDAVTVFLRDRNKTESPNAGQTMSAAAGILGVQLSKRNTYDLGNSQKPLTPRTFEKSIHYLELTSFLTFGCALMIALARDIFL
jgi:adenosylcobinamide-phosphate synthase